MMTTRTTRTTRTGKSQRPTKRTAPPPPSEEDLNRTKMNKKKEEDSSRSTTTRQNHRVSKEQRSFTLEQMMIQLLLSHLPNNNNNMENGEKTSSLCCLHYGIDYCKRQGTYHTFYYCCNCTFKCSLFLYARERTLTRVTTCPCETCSVSQCMMNSSFRKNPPILLFFGRTISDTRTPLLTHSLGPFRHLSFRLFFSTERYPNAFFCSYCNQFVDDFLLTTPGRRKKMIPNMGRYKCIAGHTDWHIPAQAKPHASLLMRNEATTNTNGVLLAASRDETDNDYHYEDDDDVDDDNLSKEF